MGEGGGCSDPIFVDASAAGTGSGTSWTNAMTSLQDGLAAAVSCASTEVWVAAGTYKPDQGGAQTPGDELATFQLINGAATYGGFPVGGGDGTFGARGIVDNETILNGDLTGNDTPLACVADLPDCDSNGRLCGGDGFCIINDNNSENSFHVVTGSGTDATALLDGFTITAGNADENSQSHYRGGGLFNDSGSPTVTNCTFSRNSAFTTGGGMLNTGNSSPTVTNCTFSWNWAELSAGGGMLISGNSNPVVTNCTFSENSSERGGGMYNGNDSSPMVTNCTFSGNSAIADGGGMYNISSSHPTVTNCTFSENTATIQGGGMFNSNDSSPMITNCTFSENSTNHQCGGMFNEGNNSNPVLDNCIYWNNSDAGGMDESAQILATTGTPVVNYSIVQGGWTGAGGTGVLDANPLFADSDLRLMTDSPAIDAGDNTAPDLVGILTDLDGNLRFEDVIDVADTGNGSAPIVDMGAYEAFEDCNNDGTSDLVDIINGESDCDSNGIPDSCDLDNCPGGDPSCQDCNGNDVLDQCDIDNGYLDTNVNGIPDICEIEPSVALAGEPGFNKDRYVSIDPTTNGTDFVATRISRVGGTDKYVDCTSLTDLGPDGWYALLIDGPLPAAGDSTYYCDLSGVTTGLHVRGCSVVPGNMYDVSMTTDGTTFSSALSIPTTPPQFDAGRHQGDTVGGLIGGIWTAPDGINTANDIVAAVQKFSLVAGSAITARIDTDGAVPNGIVSGGDILRAVSGFAGVPFGFSVTDCLTGTCVPNCP